MTQTERIECLLKAEEAVGQCIPFSHDRKPIIHLINQQLRALGYEWPKNQLT